MESTSWHDTCLMTRFKIRPKFYCQICEKLKLLKTRTRYVFWTGVLHRIMTVLRLLMVLLFFMWFYHVCCRVQNNRGHWRQLLWMPPTSCLDSLEISLFFCYILTCKCNCLLKAMCPLKSALKMGACQISYFAGWFVVTGRYIISGGL